MSYNVNQRKREIGVRMALGATETQVQAMILTKAIRLVALGLALGLAVSLFASQLVEKLLLVVNPRDSVTFILAPSLIWLVAIAACWFPAHRAARIDPAAALRNE
jgi:putative ABC transport system permease protein